MLLLQIIQQEFDPDIAREFGGAAFETGFLGVPLYDMTSLWTLLVRFAFHFLVCWGIVRCFYYPKSRRNDYYFTFMLFAITIFFAHYPHGKHEDGDKLRFGTLRYLRNDSLSNGDA